MAKESNYTPFDDVKMFMELCDDITTFEGLMNIPLYDQSESLGPDITNQVTRYYNLIAEEVGEMESASTREELLDGIMDSIFVLIGLGTTLGFPMKEAWEEICRSNMTKVDPATGKVLRRESDGKILKPEGYSKPDLKKILDVHYETKKHLQAV